MQLFKTTLTIKLDARRKIVRRLRKKHKRLKSVKKLKPRERLLVKKYVNAKKRLKINWQSLNV